MRLSMPRLTHLFSNRRMMILKNLRKRRRRSWRKMMQKRRRSNQKRKRRFWTRFWRLKPTKSKDGSQHRLLLASRPRAPQRKKVRVPALSLVNMERDMPATTMLKLE